MKQKPEKALILNNSPIGKDLTIRIAAIIRARESPGRPVSFISEVGKR